MIPLDRYAISIGDWWAYGEHAYGECANAVRDPLPGRAPGPMSIADDAGRGAEGCGRPLPTPPSSRSPARRVDLPALSSVTRKAACVVLVMGSLSGLVTTLRVDSSETFHVLVVRFRPDACVLYGQISGRRMAGAAGDDVVPNGL